MKQLNESPSLESTLKSVANDTGNSIALLYDRIGSMTQSFYDNNGHVKGIGKIVGGAKNQWYQTFYVNRLQNELYDLTRQAPKETRDLKDLLRKRPERMGELEKLGLPDVLMDVGKRLGAGELTKNAQRWKTAIRKQADYVASLADADEESSATSQKQPKDTTKGKQLSQVEMVVNDVLKNLPKKEAGEIRQEISRADNKLQALAASMKKRGLQP